MKKANIHFITGGQRSGKSVYAEKLAEKRKAYTIYLATSRIWDEALRKRIDLHKKRRNPNWTTLEEKIHISRIPEQAHVVLLDCITQWLYNIFEHTKFNKDKTIAFAKKEWKALCKKDIQLFVVSNEIGMGILSRHKQSRVFVDIQGSINQYIAKKANRVTFMVSGLPIHLKG